MKGIFIYIFLFAILALPACFILNDMRKEKAACEALEKDFPEIRLFKKEMDICNCRDIEKSDVLKQRYKLWESGKLDMTEAYARKAAKDAESAREFATVSMVMNAHSIASRRR
ncbi:MAG: hypothetical protein LBG46_06325 [Elusimicrobiota bacterium]|jgi:hypothetical protein|nr:hypothetical protein [Elusimicrobiota bacterium]